MATPTTARAAVENQYGIDHEGNIAKQTSPYAGEPWYTPIVDRGDLVESFGEWHVNGAIYLLVHIDRTNPVHYEIIRETGNEWFVLESLVEGHVALYAQYQNETDARNGFQEREAEFVASNRNL